MIEDKLRDKLLANNAISALIADRMFVLQAPQSIASPYVVYLIVNIDPLYTNTSVNDFVTIQYSCFAEKYADARAIANLIRQEIENFSGEVGGIKVVSIQFTGIGANEREKDSRKAHISYDFKIILN